MSSGRAPASKQAQLRHRLIPIGLSAPQRQLVVSRIETRDDVTHVHAIAFVEGELEHPAADLGCEPYLGCLDVT